MRRPSVSDVRIANQAQLRQPKARKMSQPGIIHGSVVERKLPQALQSGEVNHAGRRDLTAVVEVEMPQMLDTQKLRQAFVSNEGIGKHDVHGVGLRRVATN